MKKTLLYIFLSIWTGFVYGQTDTFKGTMLPRGRKVNPTEYNNPKSKVRQYKKVLVENLPMTQSVFKWATDEELIGFLLGKYQLVNDKKGEIYINAGTEVILSGELEIGLNQANIRACLESVSENINEWFSISPITKEQSKTFREKHLRLILSLKKDYGQRVADMARDIYWKKRMIKFPNDNDARLRNIEQQQLEALEIEIKKKEQQQKLLQQKIQQQKSLTH